ncbi:MAG TPA: FtsQ-type POTRA domain-containing protein [Rhizomicrobium sp.]|nr:FtsQ-type POTRA domain-containing protein [Rhizomicrobium sp.]
MRSVKAQRKSRGAVRSKPNRRGEGGKRAPVDRVVLGKKKPPRDGLFTRLSQSLPEFGPPRYPILHLTWILLLVAVVTGLFAGGHVSGAFKAVGRGADALIADAGFGLTSVHLAGNQRTQPSQIMAALGVEPGQPIFGADVQAARARLLQLPWVADAQVRRQYPDSLAVTIIEKLPFALWQMPEGTFVVERSGKVITRTDASAFPHLPLYVGDGAPEAGAELVDAIAQHRAVVARVKAMQRVSERRWNLLLDDGVVVELPETGWQKQLDVLENLIVDKAVLERDITEIDLRSPDDFFFQLRNGDKQQMTRGNAT